MKSNAIFILKTNIKTEADKNILQTVLDKHEAIERWTIDLDDCDKVLRIISSELSIAKIVALVADCGYHSEELMN
ncbi:MAG: hypothetical protein RJA07_1010 [Bacteroidota bacterium]|jgi:ribosome maturation factor RimP